MTQVRLRGDAVANEWWMRRGSWLAGRAPVGALLMPGSCRSNHHIVFPNFVKP